MKHLIYTTRYSQPRIWIFIAILLMGATESCNKFLDVAPPKNLIVNSEVFQDDKSAISAMVGIYSNMMQTQAIFSVNTTIDCGLYSDELTNTNTANEFASSSLTSDYSDINNAWAQIYSYIYAANAVLEGTAASSKITQPTKNQLTGEAKFVRAFSYFYLINLYGDVPLITSTDYLTNSKLARTSSTVVLQQVISDLEDAQNLLVSDYSFSNGEKVRPNKWAATALLARVYLYNQDWQNAKTQASAVIASNVFNLPALSNAFLKNNTEAIWQLAPVNVSYNTLEGSAFIPANSTSSVSYALTNNFIQSIETGDKRLNNWISSSLFGGTIYYYPFKYKLRTATTPLQEYYTVLRLGEIYLIRAEAFAQLNDVTDAVSDVNIIRSRAGLTALSSTLSSIQALQAIAHERRIELFAEWGHRWFDLKRTNQANAVIGALKPTTWKPYAVVWPIPVIQINANNLLTQNSGY